MISILITFLIYFINLFIPDVPVDVAVPTSVAIRREYNFSFIEKLSPDQIEVMNQIIDLNLEHERELIQLSFCESSLSPNEIGINKSAQHYSEDRGLFQINDYFHPDVSDECAFDIECSARWTNKMIEDGNGNQWTCWNKLKLFN